ncbi:MAG: prephenate dehydrogenase [Gaiellales bacterium]
MTDAAAAGLGRVAIVGTGQVGTMLGLALRDVADEVVLADRRSGAVRDSLARGAGERDVSVDEAFEADSVVLAVPVPEIVRLVEELGPKVKSGALLIDTGSAKRTVVEAMRAHVPAEVHAIGGHPLAGSERSGPEAALPELLRGAAFALTPVRDDPDAEARGRAFVEAVGSRPVVMDAELHDRVVAATSHAPHLLAAAVALASRDLPRGAVRDLAASGFSGATRLAASDPGMVSGFLAANADAVRDALKELRAALDRAEASLEDVDALRVLFTEAAAAREDAAG